MSGKRIKRKWARPVIWSADRDSVFFRVMSGGEGVLTTKDIEDLGNEGVGIILASLGMLECGSMHFVQRMQDGKCGIVIAAVADTFGDALGDVHAEMERVITRIATSDDVDGARGDVEGSA